MNEEYTESKELEKIAQAIIKKYSRFEHVEFAEILFLQEWTLKPKAAARCYKIDGHPMRFYTGKLYVIVFYENNIHYMNKEQRAILMYHELRHIGRPKLVDHNVKEFDEIISNFGVDWAEDGASVPNILDGGGL